MTTAVTVDAHAGWPVEVEQIQLGADGKPNASTKLVVPANSKMTFYAHSTMELHVRELKNDG